MAGIICKAALSEGFNDGGGGGGWMWIVPIAFGGLHVLTLFAEAHLHCMRTPPLTWWAIDLAHAVRSACLAMFVVEVGRCRFTPGFLQLTPRLLSGTFSS